MFLTIFLFEIQNRLRRPALYIYFTLLFVLTAYCFATGALPAGQKEHYNSPYLIALWCAGMSMLLMLVSSSVTGTALYRDLESNVHSYYLTYPITRAGYFWGRFAGSFCGILLLGAAIPAGSYIGSVCGPALGLMNAADYGPNRLMAYLQPFLVIALPNLLFTCCFFFGLVAMTRNIKVVYTGGLILFLGYFLSIFFLVQTHNDTLINLADPFGVTNIRNRSDDVTAVIKNTTLFPLSGAFLVNRLCWSAAGLLFLAVTYSRFRFPAFFSGKPPKNAIGEVLLAPPSHQTVKVRIAYGPSYHLRAFSHLFKMELRNLARDSYFWIILCCGLVFLIFIFATGSNTNGVPDLPRTIEFVQIDPFFNFLFLIIVFYTGEILHRDRRTGYAIISDTLPPPDWVLNASRLLTLLLLAAGFSLLPMLVGLPVQLAKGFYRFDFPVYLEHIFTLILPRLLEMTVFAYSVHVLVNHKFAGHAVAVFGWIAVFFLRDSGAFTYHLLLYSYTPYFLYSDMDGMGHMRAAVHWFTFYWLLCGGLLLIAAYLFHPRGVPVSLRERWLLARQRWNRRLGLVSGLILAAFLGIGVFIYYNVSYLNAYLSEGELESRAAVYEKTLKPLAGLPLPAVTAIRVQTELYPEEQRAEMRGAITLLNKNKQPVSVLLLDAGEITSYTLKQDGQTLSFSSPLLYPRGVLNFLRPARDTAEFRLYRLLRPLTPGDSAVLEISAAITHRGFQNSLYAGDQLRNGTFLTGLLPDFGYGEDEEISNPSTRRKYGLPPKTEGAAPGDRDDKQVPSDGKNSTLASLDVTIGTSGDQTALTCGTLVGRWQMNGRNYFHYIQRAAVYGGLRILSARYACLQDSVLLAGGRKVIAGIFYHPEHSSNLARFRSAYRDGLRYFSAAWGNYPFQAVRLAETPGFGGTESTSVTLGTYSERFAWNADLRDPGQPDYAYFETARMLAEQWWRFSITTGHTKSAWVIPDGLSRYGALKLAEKRYGKYGIKSLLQGQLGAYLFLRNRLHIKEEPLLAAGEDRWHMLAGKVALILYGLDDLIGEDRLHAALHNFYTAFAFKNTPPYAGADDLYAYLEKATPPEFRYFLEDSWQKVTLYDNRLTAVSAVPTGHNNDYLVRLYVRAAKVYIGSSGREVPATHVNDYIDVGVFGPDMPNKERHPVAQPLYLKRYRLTSGDQVITVTVHGKPAWAGIDPFNKLTDKRPEDNIKQCN